MADRIEQQFIIEARQAIDALNQLEAGLARFQDRLRRTSRTVSSYNKNAKDSLFATINLATNVKRVGEGLSNIAREDPTGQLSRGFDRSFQASRRAAGSVRTMDRNIRSAARSSAELTISFETFARVIATQFIVRALSDIRNRIQESVRGATELQKQVALIATITPGIGQDTIADEIREISSNLNIPLLETAEGAYNAVSNQVGDFGDALRFTTEAARFARTTNSTLAESVDLLSAAINAFGLTANDTADLAGQFFVTIDRGRITADELANTFGRVAPAAESIGIPIEDLLGGLAAITVQGTKTSESLTQFRGIVNSLTKPTTDMTAALDALGFSSARAAVEALGLPGLLDALRQNTDGSTEALAKLFPRVRSIGGVLSLTGDNLQRFVDNVDEVHRSGEEFADGKFMTVTATDAAQVTKALNDLNNVFVKDVGDLILQRANTFIQAAGGIEDLSAAVRRAIPVVESLGVALIGLGAAAAAFKVTAFVAALGPIGLAATSTLLLVAALQGVVRAIELDRENKIKEALDEAGVAAEDNLKKIREANRELIKSEREVTAEITSEVRKRVAEFNKSEDIRATSDTITRINERLVADTRSGLDQILKARQGLVRELSTAISNSADQIRESELNIRGISERQSDRDFATRIRNLDAQEQTTRQIRRSLQLANTAQSEFNAAIARGSDEEIELARSALERAQSVGEAAASRAAQLDDTQLLESAERSLSFQSSRQIQLEKELIGVREQRTSKLEDERNQAAAVNSEIEKQAKIIRENISQFDKQGNVFSEREQQRRQQQLQTALGSLSQLSTTGLGTAEQLGLADFIRGVQDTLTNNPARLNLDIQSVIEQLEKAQLSIDLQVNLEFPERAVLQELFPDEAIRSADQIGDAVSRAGKEFNTLLQNQTRANEAAAEQEGVQNRIGRAVQLLSERSEALSSRAQANQGNILGESFSQAAGFADQLQQSLQRVQEEGVTPELVNRLNEITVGIEDAVGAAGAFRGRSLAGIQEVFRAIAPEIERLGELGRVEPLGPEQTERLQQLSTLRDTFQASSDSMKEAEASALRVRTDAEATRDAYQAGARALSGQNISGNFAGTIGLSRFADGGFARGTDTIAAALSPGESVINSRSTQRFFSQLQAMNAGIEPVFRSDGGTVQVGDINVTMQSSGSTQADGRKIAETVNREIRLGRTKIRTPSRTSSRGRRLLGAKRSR